MKKCNKCLKEFEIGSFYYGRRTCKRCVKKLAKINNNKPDVIERRRKYAKQYREEQKKLFQSLDKGAIKQCNKCLKTRSISFFYSINRLVCKKCDQKIHSDYLKKPEKRKQYLEYQKNYRAKGGGGYERQQDRKELAKALVLEFKTNRPCMDCNQCFHPACMEFDHRIRSEKIKDISYMVSSGYKMEKIEAEMSKCDLVCANCHRLRSVKAGLYSNFYPV